MSSRKTRRIETGLNFGYHLIVVCCQAALVCVVPVGAWCKRDRYIALFCVKSNAGDFLFSWMLFKIQQISSLIRAIQFEVFVEAVEISCFPLDSVAAVLIWLNGNDATYATSWIQARHRCSDADIYVCSLWFWIRISIWMLRLSSEVAIWKV